MDDETAPNESSLQMNRWSNYGKNSLGHIKNEVLSFSATVRNHYFKSKPCTTWVPSFVETENADLIEADVKQWTEYQGEWGGMGNWWSMGVNLGTRDSSMLWHSRVTLRNNL